MTLEQIIYFINHIADAKHSDGNLRTLQAIWFMGIPGTIGLFHCLALPKIFRVKRKNLIWIAISMFWWSIILPMVVVLHSQIYIGDSYVNMAYMFMLYLFFAALYIICIQEYFPPYLYTTDAEYMAATAVPDGSFIYKNYPNKMRLYALAIWIAAIAVLFTIVLGMFFIDLLKHQPFGASINVTCVLSFMFFFYLLLLRWLVRCPNCHRPIYNIKYDLLSQKDGIYFVKIAFHVLFKKKFECITCHAHYTVK